VTDEIFTRQHSHELSDTLLKRILFVCACRDGTRQMRRSSRDRLQGSVWADDRQVARDTS